MKLQTTNDPFAKFRDSRYKLRSAADILLGKTKTAARNVDLKTVGKATAALAAAYILDDLDVIEQILEAPFK